MLTCLPILKDVHSNLVQSYFDLSINHSCCDDLHRDAGLGQVQTCLVF